MRDGNVLVLPVLTLLIVQGCMEPAVPGQGNEPLPIVAGQVLNEEVVANHAPIITSIPPEQINQGELYLYQATAIDPDQDTLLWSLTVSPAGLAIDPATGLIGAMGLTAGTYSVTVNVEDGRSGSDSQSYTLTVKDGPVIYTSPPGYTFTGTPYRYYFGAVDTDGLKLVYSLVTGPGGILLDPDTGWLEWTPAMAGIFDIGLLASNPLGKTATQDFPLTVIAADGVLIVSTPVTEGFVAERYGYRVTAISHSGAAINYLLVNAPPGMAIDQQTGRIDWIPASAGRFTVEVQAVRDNGYMHTQNFSVRVRTPEQMDSMFNSIISGLFRNLGAGDTNGAMQYLTVEAQRRLGPVLTDLLPFIDEVTASYTAPVRMSLHPEMAEYLVRRTTENDTRVYTVTFLLDFNGDWKINDL